MVQQARIVNDYPAFEVMLLAVFNCKMLLSFYQLPVLMAQVLRSVMHTTMLQNAELLL